MEDTLIQYDTAKLAKEKKFWIENTQNFRSKIGTMYLGITSSQSLEDIKRIYFEESEEYVILVRQSILQKWLREVHNIHIVISVDFYKDGINYLWQVFKYAPEHKYCSIGTLCYGDNGEYPTYELALEAGIIKGLELIK